MFISIATTMPPADDQRSRLLMIGSLAICAMQEVLADNGITDQLPRIEINGEPVAVDLDQLVWDMAEASRIPVVSAGLDQPQTAAASDVLAERMRQIEAEGWTPEHDDRYSNGQLISAATAYASRSRANIQSGEERTDMVHVPVTWPWATKWWKPGTTRRNLVKSAALLLAEIERLDRAEGSAA